MTSYEFGSKNKLFGNALSLDRSVYQVDWKDIQQIVNLPQCAIRFIANLGKARSRGFDLQANVQAGSWSDDRWFGRLHPHALHA